MIERKDITDPIERIIADALMLDRNYAADMAQTWIDGLDEEIWD